MNLTAVIAANNKFTVSFDSGPARGADGWRCSKCSSKLHPWFGKTAKWSLLKLNLVGLM